jgi:putative spermidine/putrescine transport system permease protein
LPPDIAIADMSAAAPKGAAGTHPNETSQRAALMPYLQSLPLWIVLAVFLALPIVMIVVVSFWDDQGTTIAPAFLLDNYRDFLGNWVTWNTYLQTIRYAVIVWVLTLGIGFSVAYVLAFHIRSSLWQMVLFQVCAIPFLTSNVIRMISWIPFLGRNGLLNQFLMDLGITDHPLEFLLFSPFAVCLAFVHLYTLFMVVPIFNTMMRIDRRLIEAANDAGAKGWQILVHVILPLCKPGIAIGTVFVVTLVMGDFYVVKVMSGGTDASVVSAMYDDISTLLFPHAAASAVILLIVLSVVIAGIMRLVDVRRELVGDR